MPTDALDDFVQFTQSLGGFTQSVGQLYDMKVRVEADKYAMDIGKMDTAFLTDMMRPAGDPARISVKNFRDSLEAYNKDLDSRIGQITNPAVRAAVSRQYQSSRNEFNLRVAEKYMAQEVANTQATWNAGLQEYMNLPVDPSQLESHLSGLEERFAEARKLGLFDESTMLSLEAPAMAYDRGRIVVRDELGKAGGSYDAAAASITDGSYDDTVKKAALDELTRQGQNADAIFDERMTQAFSRGSWDFIQKMDYVSANFSGTRKHRDEILGRLSADGLNSEIANASVWVSDRVSDPARTYWGLMYAKQKLSQTIDQSRFRTDKDYAKQMETELSRLDSAIKEEEEKATKGKDIARDTALAEFTALESAFVNGTPITKGGQAVKFSDLYAKYMDIRNNPALGSLAQDLWDRMNRNTIYRDNLRNYDELLGRGSTSAVMQAVRNAFSDQTLDLRQVSQGELFPKGSGKVSIENQSRLDIMMGDILADTQAWIRSGDFKDEQEIRDHVLKLAIPYLEHWDLVGEMPMDRAGGKNTMLAEYGDMVQERQLDPLSEEDPLLGTTITPKGWEKAAELYRSRARDLIDDLSGKGTMPSFSDLIPVTDRKFVGAGDLAFRPKSGKGMYFVDIIDGKPAIVFKEDPTSPYAGKVLK